jgi:hypothetical protein
MQTLPETIAGGSAAEARARQDLHPAGYPRILTMFATGEGGAIVQTEHSGLYYRDPHAAWSLMGEMVDPRLNVAPQGNC